MQETPHGGARQKTRQIMNRRAKNLRGGKSGAVCIYGGAEGRESGRAREEISFFAHKKPEKVYETGRGVAPCGANIT